MAKCRRGWGWDDLIADDADERFPADDEAVRAPSKRRKNRKRWCKGREGVEHKPVWRDLRATKRYLVFRCEVCGKELETVWSYWWHSSLIRAEKRDQYEKICNDNGFPLEVTTDLQKHWAQRKR